MGDGAQGDNSAYSYDSGSLKAQVGSGSGSYSDKQQRIMGEIWASRTTLEEMKNPPTHLITKLLKVELEGDRERKGWS